MAKRIQTISADLGRIPHLFEKDTNADRVETGLLQINQDEPAVFIRSINAYNTACTLQELLAITDRKCGSDFLDPVTRKIIENHIDLLTSAAECASIKA